VVGAGNVGCALAADLTLRGSEVRIFNRSPERVRALREAGGIKVTGAIEGFATLDLVTDSLVQSVAGTDVVAVTVPTAALPSYAAALAEATTEDQLIWLNPGHSGGALFLSAAFARRGVGERRICQLTTASHISRLTAPAEVRVFLLARASVAAMPAKHLDFCHARLDALLPGQFSMTATILEADLANLNAIMHPPGMVCNAGWIEATSGEFGFYRDGTRAAVARVIEAIDHERIALAHRLDVPAVAFPELFHRLGFTPSPGASALEAIQASELIHPIQSPPTLDHRYLHEDIAWGLVPWMHLATAVGSPAPVIAALTNVAGALNGIDYTQSGLTLEHMGLAGKNTDQIRAHVA
jgi:opine dehydrogenase